MGMLSYWDAFIHSPHKGFWVCLGDLPSDMSRDVVLSWGSFHTLPVRIWMCEPLSQWQDHYITNNQLFKIIFYWREGTPMVSGCQHNDTLLSKGKQEWQTTFKVSRYSCLPSHDGNTPTGKKEIGKVIIGTCRPYTCRGFTIDCGVRPWEWKSKAWAIITVNRCV